MWTNFALFLWASQAAVLRKMGFYAASKLLLFTGSDKNMYHTEQWSLATDI